MPEEDPSPPPVRVPEILNRLAAIGWRLLVIAAALFVAGVVLVRLRLVVVPLLLGLLIAAALNPPATWLQRRGWPPMLATWIVLLGGLGILAGIGFLIVPGLVADLGDVGDALAAAYDDVREWLTDGPLGLDPATIDRIESDVTSRLGGGNGILSTATLVFEVGAGAILALIAGFFYVKDRDRITGAFLSAIPAGWRGRAEVGLEAGSHVLARYLLGVLVVGAADAMIIGVGLMLIGVPLVFPLMVLTFLAAFFPIVGAVLAGGVAALIALAANGLGDALLVVGLTTLVQQVDGDLIAPYVYSRAINLHPLAILVVLTAGGIVGGVLGALLAVPVLAVVLAVRRAWLEVDDQAGVGE